MVGERPAGREVPLVPLDRDDEAMVRSWASTTAHTFLAGEPSDGDLAWRRDRTRDHRITVGVDDDQVVATFRSFDTTLSVPGGALVDVNAVTGITVLATHRRRGLLSRWMTQEMPRAHDAGQVASVLIASEAPIYGRFGFGVSSTWGGWTIDTRRARWRSHVPLAPGTLRVVTGEQWAEAAEPLYDRVARRRAGSIGRTRDVFRWLAQLVPDLSDVDKKRRFVLHRSPDGTVDGALVHSVDGGWDDARLRVVDLLATDDAVSATLVRYACEVDFVLQVEVHDFPPHWEVPWMLDDVRAASSGPQVDGLYVRVHDVPAALTARAYAAPGRLVVEVHDPMSQVDGRYLLEVDASLSASCSRVGTQIEPDLSCDVQALASLWLGGGAPPGLAALVASGRARVRDDAALASAHVLLSWPTAPHVLTHF